MGVIRNFSSLSESESDWNLEDFIENETNNNNNNLNNNNTNNNNINNNGNINLQNELNDANDERSLQDEYLEAYARQERNRNRRLHKSKRSSLRPEPTFRALGCRGKSYKKYRRYENANMLSQTIANTSIDLDDNELLNDISIHDFMPQTASAFTQLLMEAKNMQAWNNFILQSEDEQEYLIRSVSVDGYEDVDCGQQAARGKKKEKGRKRSSNSMDGDCQFVDANSRSKPEASDRRASHPSFSAAECFERISYDIKNLLRKKHVPLGILASIEEEVINFFDTTPYAVYKSCLTSAYQRLLLHACCQYMDLRCCSYDKGGSRWSRVQNLHRGFERPEVLLTSYVESHFS